MRNGCKSGDKFKAISLQLPPNMLIRFVHDENCIGNYDEHLPRKRHIEAKHPKLEFNKTKFMVINIQMKR